jgi:hypothetical protein
LGALDTAYTAANRCLDRAASDHVYGVFSFAALWWTPELRAFRADPRFQALVARYGLMPYYQQYGPPDDCELKNNKLTCH